MDLNISDHEKELEMLSNKLTDNMAIVFTEEEAEQARAELGFTLAVKQVGDRGYNKVVFKEVMRNGWKAQGGMRFIEVENGTLLVKFNREEDMEKVLSGGPWRFMGRAVLVERWESDRNLDDIFTDKIQIWVQIHKLPIMYRGEKCAAKFAEKVGKIIKCGSKAEGKNDGKDERDEKRVFVRFLVEIDLRKPVVPGWELILPNGTKHWVEFRYERLPNICFVCGNFGHDTSQCLEHPDGTSKVSYGPWIKAEHVAIERLRESSHKQGKMNQKADGDRRPESSKVGESQGSLELAQSGYPLEFEQPNHNCGKLRDSLESGGNKWGPETENFSRKLETGKDKGKLKVGYNEPSSGPGDELGRLMLGDKEIMFNEDIDNIFGSPAGLRNNGPAKERGEKRKAARLVSVEEGVYHRKGVKERKRCRGGEPIDTQDDEIIGDGKAGKDGLVCNTVVSASAGNQPRWSP